ncbi:hypothetical protein [Pseudomonas sp.]|uniref:hypothetical protein n=1 Tax=Pseudomonas sp. TaxID=306 RepID=UPI002906D85A|nr:hypothetical protein [Pseudomonas sp.]MDU4255787.1 hypothetical protein [Pseudomonas sp.]
MTNFTVRVELYDADEWEDYETLHKAMAAKGFSKTITGDDGVIWALPDAEYNLVNSSKTIQQVRDMAQEAANVTKKKSGILVTQSAGRSWVGLKKPS